MKKQNLILALLLCIILTITGCEEYSEWEARTATENYNTITDAPPEEYVNEGTGGRTLADYVNEGLNGTGSTNNEVSGTSTEYSDGSEITFGNAETPSGASKEKIQKNRISYLASLQYNDEPDTEINNNSPYFTNNEIAFAKNMATNSSVIDNVKTYSEFSDLDGLKRTGTAYAILNKTMMPGDDVIREDISSVKPTGWVQARYSWIDNGGWIYNRCHLIAWSLSGENANEKNLMTGTRYFNTEGMLPYEIKTLKYLNKFPDNHVLYRATPVYSGNELLARGLLLEAYSIEDDGKFSFCAYIHNVEPGVDINYATGKSQMNEYMKILKKGGTN